MSFTIIKNFEPLPDYARLRNLAEQNEVLVVGNEQAGSFSCNGVEGAYRFSEDRMLGKFIGHKVTGEFSWAAGQVTITVMGKPFWLTESLLKRKIVEGLETLLNKLA